MELIYQFIWIVPFLPFLASILIGLGLLGATIALAQRDIKKGLAYSTMS
jgi:NADH:ubiquinone oxidoreductase subunit 5 (subunit L)/multisubunit Na+/H+ antiporter MnhA subunit